MNNDDKLKLVIDKLHDIDVNISLIYEKMSMILEIMEKSKHNECEN